MIIESFGFLIRHIVTPKTIQYPIKKIEPMKLIKIISLLLFSNLLFAQNNFSLDLSAKEYVNDSLWFGTPSARIGFEDLFQFKLDENKNVENLSTKINIPYSLYNLKIDHDNFLKGKVDYPQPVALMFIDAKANTGFATHIFFIEKGNYKIDLPKISNGLFVDVPTKSNLEYRKLENFLKPVYVKFEDPNKRDSLLDFNKKQEMIAHYIKGHPNSYVALWEIVNDYTLYNYHSKYLENMKLFSKEIKNSLLYKKVETKLMAESKTRVGNKIPAIYFDKNNSLTEKDFKKHQLTFIDYWSTTCAPCIKGMPEIVNLYNDFKDKGVNFISITDESKDDRIKLANQILLKNNAEWINYFDINKDFSKKVNATSYPLHFIIDGTGTIVARIEGDLDEARKVIIENLK